MPRPILGTADDGGHFQYLPSYYPAPPSGAGAGGGGSDRKTRGTPFTEEEDAVIFEEVTASGATHEQPFTNWARLASLLPGRAGKQIRNRWLNHLDPELNHDAFTREDDILLHEAYEALGSKWCDMSKQYFHGKRSENMLKNRYNCRSYKRLIAQNFSKEAYETLVVRPAASDSQPGEEDSGSSDKEPSAEGAQKEENDAGGRDKDAKTDKEEVASEVEEEGEENTSPREASPTADAKEEKEIDSEKQTADDEEKVSAEEDAKDKEEARKSGEISQAGDQDSKSEKGGGKEAVTATVNDKDGAAGTKRKDPHDGELTTTKEDGRSKKKKDEHQRILFEAWQNQQQRQIQAQMAKQHSFNQFMMQQGMLRQQQMMNQQMFAMAHPQMMMHQHMMAMAPQMMANPQIVPPQNQAQGAKPAAPTTPLAVPPRPVDGKADDPENTPRGLMLFDIALPPKGSKLGVFLETNTALSMPEIKSLAKTSPLVNQIPTEFHENCCIASLRSDVIGYVQPKTAQQCAALIAKAVEESPTMHGQMEIALVPLKRKALTPPSQSDPLDPQNWKRRRSGGRKSHEDKLKRNIEKKRILLDFFGDSNKMTPASFCREMETEERIRSVIQQALQGKPRLGELAQKRDTVAARQEAYGIIDEMIPDPEKAKAEFDGAKKDALINFFSDSSRRTLQEFCSEEKVDIKVRTAVERFIGDDSIGLTALVDQRNLPARRKEAVQIITKFFSKALKESNEEKEKQATEERRRMKMALQEFFGASIDEITSFEDFCKDKKFSIKCRVTMRRIIDREPRLAELENHRNDAVRRQEALEIIDNKLLAEVKTPYSDTIHDKKSTSDAGAVTGDAASKDSADASSNATRNRRDFFHPDHIKSVAAKLDFDARPRMSRDGSKQIDVHERKMPDEMLMLLILDFNNRVARGRSLSYKGRAEVLSACAKLLFYDHGYSKVRGMTNLEMWESRLENAYISGAETNPLASRNKGKIPLSSKWDAGHPGLFAQLFDYAEEILGKEASLREKALIMNEKSRDDWQDDPSLPIVNTNASQLKRWVDERKSARAEGSDKATKQAGSDSMSLDQIDKKFPGLIQDLYDFAIEALGPDVSYHLLATCMNERSKENVEEDPSLPLVTVSKQTLPNWVKKHGLADFE